MNKYTNNKKEIKKSEKRNKKRFLLLTSISLLTMLGGTLAYFTTSTDIINHFKSALYQHKIEETFESPKNWTPGTTTEKEISVTNTGSINMALRASYTETWVNANGVKISLKDENNNVASIIHFNDTWTKDQDGYFYYGSKDNLTALKPNETSSSFINSVTFNENIKSSLKQTTSDDGKTITYTSTGNGYDDARYILTIKIDTIQFDQAHEVW